VSAVMSMVWSPVRPTESEKATWNNKMLTQNMKNLTSLMD